ncbi:MAG: toxin-antitoxin system HicB family antitoxin [Candidatus Hydrogenedentes bacterium]|nr:toxin-antitoxin system HicB family antitoxin [Candidatus Hydrogenedentota bacterium]
MTHNAPKTERNEAIANYVRDNGADRAALNAAAKHFRVSATVARLACRRNGIAISSPFDALHPMAKDACHVLTVRMRPELHKRITDAAWMGRESMNNFIVRIMAEAVERIEAEKAPAEQPSPASTPSPTEPPPMIHNLDILTLCGFAFLLAACPLLGELCRSGRSPVPRKSDWCDEPGLAQVTSFVSAKEKP